MAAKEPVVSNIYVRDGINFYSIIATNPQLLNVVCTELSNKLLDLVKSKSLIRLAFFNQQQTFIKEIKFKLNKAIENGQNQAVDKLKQSKPPVKQSRKQKQVSKEINKIVDLVSNHLAFVECCAKNVEAGFGACQETCLIAMAFLQTLIGLGDVKLFNIEAAMISALFNDYINHELLVIDRDCSSDFSRPDTWGENCIIYDPRKEIFSTLDSIPKTSSIWEIKEKGELQSGMKLACQTDTLFNLHALSKYFNDPIYGAMAKSTYKSIHVFLHGYLVGLTKTAGLDNEFMQQIKTQITLTALSEFSGQKGWKSYKNGTIFLLESSDEKLVKELVLHLKEISGFVVAHMKNPVSNNDVIKITNVNLNKLPSFIDNQVLDTKQDITVSMPAYG